MTTPARLEVVGATVRFGRDTAVDEVDLTVAPGEVVVVLGPSGSGKSTLLRAVAGLQALDEGSIRLDGRDVRGQPPHRRGVGLMFQDHALFPHRDVARNVGFGLRMQRRAGPDVEVRVAELLALVGLAGMENRAVQTLSGGEQQRVALARALAPEPRLLLLDEPLGSLDRRLRERLVGELQQLFAELGQTVVAVTHDQAEAFALADRLVLLSRGAVVRVGTPAEVWADPRTVTVAEMLGFTNIARGEFDGSVVHTPWGPVALPAAHARVVDVLVRPTAVHLDEAGATAGRVVARRFAGARTVIQVASDSAPRLEVEVTTPGSPRMGELVRFRIDPAGVSTLDP